MRQRAACGVRIYKHDYFIRGPGDFIIRGPRTECRRACVACVVVGCRCRRIQMCACVYPCRLSPQDSRDAMRAIQLVVCVRYKKKRFAF